MANSVVIAALLTGCGLLCAGPAPVVLPTQPLHFEPYTTGNATEYIARGAGFGWAISSTGATFADRQGDRFQLVLAGARRGARLSASVLQPGRSSYLIGSDATQWRRAVPHYGRVQASEVYRGINLVYYGNQQQLEYDFIVQPHADSAQIRLRFPGAQSVRIDEQGELRIQAKSGELRQHRPVIYQQVNGARQLIAGGYTRRSDGTFSFMVGHYDHALPLVIDPTLTFASFLGGRSDERGNAVAVDSTGNVFVTGATISTDFLLSSNPLQANPGGGGADVFITKFSPSGQLIYSTFFGGNDYDESFGIAVDAQGNAFVSGITYSTNLPLANSYQNAKRGAANTADLFVCKLNPAGTQLIYSTYLGGVGDEDNYGIAIDAAGNAVVIGSTNSTAYPTTSGAYQTALRGGADGVITKLNAAGNGLIFSTLLGGQNVDIVYAVALDAGANVFLCGDTDSPNFPVTSGAYQPTFRGGFPVSQDGQNSDAWAARLSADGRTLLYSTYLGGTDDETANAVAVDGDGNAYVAGVTYSADYPTTQGSYQQRDAGPTDGFVTKLNPTGTQVIFSTLFGGNASDSVTAISVDGSRNVYLAGDTTSTDLPTPGAVQATNGGGRDVMLAQLNAAGTTVLQATYLGGSADDFANGAAFAANGVLCAAGVTPSSTFPTTSGVAQPSYVGGSNDAFVACLSFPQGPLGPPPQISAAGIGNAAGYQSGTISPGEIIVVYGTNFGPSQLAGLQLGPNGLVASNLSNTRVLFNGVAAPVIYSAANQVSVAVPYELAGASTAQVQLEYLGQLSSPVTISVGASVPGVFTADASGKGPAAALNQDNSPNSVSNPADKGSIVILFGTGEGQTTPAGRSGLPATATYPKPVQAVAVTIGGIPAELAYAGAAPNFIAGALQVNVRVPANVGSGAQPVIVTIGGVQSQAGVTIAVR